MPPRLKSCVENEVYCPITLSVDSDLSLFQVRCHAKISANTVKALLRPLGAYLISGTPEEALKDRKLIKRSSLLPKSDDKDIYGGFSILYAVFCGFNRQCHMSNIQVLHRFCPKPC